MWTMLRSIRGAEMVDFPKLTSDQCQLVIDWITERLVPWADVWELLERIIDHHGFRTGAPEMRAYAEQMPLRVVGGNGGWSWKASPTYADVDVAFMLDRDFNRGDIAFLLWAARARVPYEVYQQQARITIDGLELEIDGRPRRLDFPKLGREHNGVVWIVPGVCRHCMKHFNDGKFCVVDGSVIHESCRT